MRIDIEIPDDLTHVFAPGADPARTMLETLALESYRSKCLSEYDVLPLFGFKSRFDVHGFLKEHGVYLRYDMKDLEHDLRQGDRKVAILDARNKGSS